MKKMLSKCTEIFKNIFAIHEKISLKHSYKLLAILAISNFMLLMFWAVNPWMWSGLTGIIFDVLVGLYLLISFLGVTTTLIKRFNDADIHPINALIYLVSMMGISILIRLRIWSSGIIIILLIVFFLSHFYLLMLIMMPSKETIDTRDQVDI